MSRANICACDHVKTMHRTTTIPNDNPPPVRITLHHECQMDGCRCIKFKLVKTMASRLVNYREANTVKIVGVAHSKLRNSIGAVGIEVDPITQIIYTKMAYHWDRNDINNIAPELSNMYHKHEWSNTIVDQMVGEHLIQGFRRGGIPLKIIFIKKNIAEVSEIRRVKTLDLIEMVQFTLQIKIAHRIKFSPTPSAPMVELEEQIALYAEATTEAGGVNYYAPGDELDDLTKALMIAVFAARPFMQDSMKIIGGPISEKNIESFDQLSKELEPMPKFSKHIKGI